MGERDKALEDMVITLLRGAFGRDTGLVAECHMESSNILALLSKRFTRPDNESLDCLAIMLTLYIAVARFAAISTTGQAEKFYDESHAMGKDFFIRTFELERLSHVARQAVQPVKREGN